MERRVALDLLRQAAVAAAALFMVGATVVGSRGIVAAVETEPRSPVDPAGYAFGIWGLIFLLALGYAGWQVLPPQRENPLLRGIG